MEIFCKAEVKTPARQTFYLCFVFKTRALMYGNWGADKGYFIAQTLADVNAVSLVHTSQSPLCAAHSLQCNTRKARIKSNPKASKLSVNGDYAIQNEDGILLSYHSINQKK